MSDLLNLGIDFGLTFFENKEKVSRKKYLQENVDYYKQGLDDTGIKVDYERDSDEDKDGDEDRNRDVDITQVGVSQNESSENPNVLNFQQTSGENNIVSSAFSQELGNTPSQLLARESKTYGQVLGENGFKDRSPTNLFGLDFYSATLPKSAKEAGKNLIAGINVQTVIDTVIKKAAGPSMSLPISIVNAFRDGKGIPDAMGNNSFRPDHAILGGIYDLNASRQFQDVAINQAALASYTGSGMSNQFSPTTGYNHVSGRATGFNGYIGGQLVTRAAGSTNYNGVYSLDYQQIKAADALSKGFLPSGYDAKNETGERGVTPQNEYGGMYSEKGYYSDLSGTSAQGSMKAAVSLTETYFGKGMATGTNVALITKSLQQARDQYILGYKKVKNPKSLSVIIRDNIRGFSSSPAQAIKNKVFEGTRPTRDVAEYYDDLGNKKMQDNIAEAQAKSLADYKAMVARQQKASRYDDGSNDDGSQSASDQASTADQQGGMFTAKGGFMH